MERKEKIYHTVMSCIKEHDLMKSGDRVLVAVSGGADSVALLLVMIQAGYSCEAVHCNFHLRGEESDRDEAFVRTLCRKCSVRLHVKHFDTVGYADRHGVSIEMAARDLRYAYFEELREERRMDWIAVAHHRNDNVETLLLNLIRGAGLKGLTGMSYRNGYVVRPMLDVPREDVELYLNAKGQDYVTDSTNLETEAVRNKIRLNVLPMLQTINPGIMETLHETILHLNDAYTLYGMKLDELKRRVRHGHRIDIGELCALPASPTVLYELLSEYGFNSSQVDDVYQHLYGEPGKVYESAEWRLLRDRESLVLGRKDEKCECLCKVLPLQGVVQVTQDYMFTIRREHFHRDFKIPRGRDVVCMDLDKMEYPITVRLAGKGDRFVPFGMKGQKLVSDYLTDVKKNLFEKERQLVVCSGDNIAWLVNERPDNRFRIEEGQTKHVLLIQCRTRG